MSLSGSRHANRRVWLSATYRPHAVPGWVFTAFATIIALQGLARGLDYLADPPNGGEPLLFYVEQFGSPRGWGVAITTAYVWLLVALISTRLAWLISAHLIAAAVYIWYGIALAQGVLVAGDGWRFVTPVFGSVAAHAVFLRLLARQVRSVASGQAAP